MSKKPAVSSVPQTTTNTVTINRNFENIQEAFDNTLSLDGSTPNAMQADLDLNGNDILNVNAIFVGGEDYVATVEDLVETAKNYRDTAAIYAAEATKAVVVPVVFGAVGDGVTNDTAAFKALEASPVVSSVVDLGGLTYSLTSFWSDSVNGVKLTRDYVNGTLLMDGMPLVMDSAFGIANSAAMRASLPASTSVKSLAMRKTDDNTYAIWRHLTGPAWCQYDLTRSGANLPFNWTAKTIKQVLAYKAAREAGVVYTGGWATDTASTALSSAGDTYISGRAQQSLTAGDYVEITFTGGGDIYVIFTGRNMANYVNVLLDGAQTYLTLPDDGSGNRYFDSYTATDLSHKQSVLVASGVPTGSHTIRLTVSTSRNPSSAGTRFVFNSLAWSEDATGPWQPETDAPLWVTSQAVLQHQRRKYGNNYYYASAAGTTGATPPTHTSGSVSDGGVTWVYTATSSYSLTEHRLQAAGSQLEYAYEIKPAGATSYEDVGGALHGNEAQTSFQWYLAGSKITPSSGSWIVGRNFEIVENLNVTHSQIGGGATVVVNTRLSRRWTRDGVEIKHKHTRNLAGEYGYFYPAMDLYLAWDAGGFKYGAETIQTASDVVRETADYFGVAGNPIIGRTKDTLCIVRGPCLTPNGAAGVASTLPAPARFTAWMDVSPESVNSFKGASSLFLGKAMNISGANAPGYSSVVTKVYSELSARDNPVTFAAGSVLECRAFYGLMLEGA